MPAAARLKASGRSGPGPLPGRILPQASPLARHRGHLGEDQDAGYKDIFEGSATAKLCVNYGLPIPQERLEAVPGAFRCV